MGTKTVSLPNLHKNIGSEDPEPAQKKNTKTRGVCLAGGPRDPILLPPISEKGQQDTVRQQNNVRMANGSVRYIEECESHQKLPIPMPFVTMSQVRRFDVSGQDLLDADLLSIIPLLDTRDLDAVRLNNNSLLTDRSLVPFLTQLSTVATNLQSISLSHCMKAGRASQEMIISMVKNAPALRRLDLSRVSLVMQFQASLCEAIGRHPKLESVSLAETGLKNQFVTSKCITALFGSKTVDSFDLSWNCFSGERSHAWASSWRLTTWCES
jgi:hypothetical protein